MNAMVDDIERVLNSIAHQLKQVNKYNLLFIILIDKIGSFYTFTWSYYG